MSKEISEEEVSKCMDCGVELTEENTSEGDDLCEDCWEENEDAEIE